ncbi:phosphotransferase [uncultured Tateyamaria sp.]|uniref:phosphotransferase n=1 Tax=uncultured Tateyamaria sp. TaxID=455651 RepID=UPI00262FEC7F|nr:phosphotransferase [uncultured Tateyamaria sp.]
MNPPLAAWDLSGDARPLPGGHRNTVLRVGNHVLKTTRRSEAALRWLEPVQTGAATCGLYAPRLLPSRDGSLNVEGWTCEPYCAGVPTSPCDIAGNMRDFHALGGDIPQRPGFASARDLLERDAGGDVDLSAMPGELAASLRAVWSDLAGAETAIHADLNPSNILRDADGRVTLIDWDEARRDVTLFDSADAAHPARQAWEVACCWHIEPDRARTLAHLFSL